MRAKRFGVCLNDGTRFQTYNPGDDDLVNDLLNHDVRINSKAPERPGLLSQIVVSWLPFVLLIGVWLWFMRRSSGSGGVFGFGKSRARQMTEGEVKVTLDDVAGIEEAKEEVAELVEFLRNPDKFQNLGGRYHVEF